jgi:anti-sigma regulatory factor (Ser/Thr protein kinase)
MAAVNTRTGPIWCTTLPPVAGSVPAARHFASEAIESLGRGDVVPEAELLVSELAANAVLHARTPLRVSVLCHDDRVRIEVRDDNPTLPRRLSPDPLELHGRGVMLVDTLAAAWGVNGNSQGKTIWFELEDGRRSN